MKAIYTLDAAPASGVVVTIEGQLTRLLFDITTHQAPEEEENAPENLYDCESVDCVGRTKADMVSAIVDDRYPMASVQALTANYELAKDEASGLTPEKRQEYLEEYAAYQSWRAHAKEVAVTALGLMS